MEEAPEYFRAGNSQFTPEKLVKDQFVVEDLLDFSNEDEADGSDETALEEVTESSTVTAVESCNSSISGGDQLLTNAVDLCEPYDELAELEWLSNFVEESFSSEEVEKLHLISGVQSATSSSAQPCKITILPPAEPANYLPVPAKARSKRPRGAGSNWSSRQLSIIPVEPSSRQLSTIPVEPAKKIKRAGPAAAVDGRKCLHCATEKTPQWRTGPMGPKTLCNACGVRYKSGRLVPEYRPAASPTFVLTKHSNSHRKVLELQRQKETAPLLHVSMGPADGFLIDGFRSKF